MIKGRGVNRTGSASYCCIEIIGQPVQEEVAHIRVVGPGRKEPCDRGALCKAPPCVSDRLCHLSGKDHETDERNVDHERCSQWSSNRRKERVRHTVDCIQQWLLDSIEDAVEYGPV